MHGKLGKNDEKQRKYHEFGCECDEIVICDMFIHAQMSVRCVYIYVCNNHSKKCVQKCTE